MGMIDIEEYAGNENFYVISYRGDVFIIDMREENSSSLMSEILYLMNREVKLEDVHTVYNHLKGGIDLHAEELTVHMENGQHITYIESRNDEWQNKSYPEGILISRDLF